MTDSARDAGLPELGIPITSQTPAAHIVSVLRQRGYTDLSAMKQIAAALKDQVRATTWRPPGSVPMTLEQRGPGEGRSGDHDPAELVPDSSGGDPIAYDPVPEPAAADVRAWARENEIKVPARGALSPEIVDRYKAAQAG